MGTVSLMLYAHFALLLARGSAFYQGDNFGKIEFGFSCEGVALAESGNNTLSSCRMLCATAAETKCTTISWSVETGDCKLYKSCHKVVQASFLIASRIQVVPDYQLSLSKDACSNMEGVLSAKRSLEACREECESRHNCGSFAYGKGGPVLGSCALSNKAPLLGHDISTKEAVLNSSLFDCYIPGEVCKCVQLCPT